ncbi:anti-sigma F factor regulatory protein [Candidatus Photodesmus blepharus]|uniref:Anti-sigma factor antagonist n=1 Tax=Candidatus Photodesmus blepharonis TaxID=1179155 RepID=A0A084CPM4_9GAMM|nr:STAS domain-containing protein [Candidatus Photodesmus blepharus]KEY91753.1 anti-sigma F factor regulatory protein [Candidatus Photodesmus blepharus]
MEMLKVEKNETVLTLVINGNLDANGSRIAQTYIDEIINKDTHNEIELDFSKVSFLDSSGIGALVYLYKRLIERERNMRIKNVTGQPLEIINLLHIDQAIPINSR